MSSSGTVPAQPASPVGVSPRPLAVASSAIDLSGYIDGVHTKIAVVPEAVENLMSGIIVKAPTAAWGGLAAGGSADYGKGQFISFHRFLAGSTDPNNTLMFRVDKTGGLGLTGGVHIATGLRQDVGYTTTQAVWINPSLDLVDIVMTGVAAKIQPFLLATNSVGGVLFKVLNNGAIQSAADIAARFGLSTQIGLGDVAGFPGIQFGNDSTTFIGRGSIAGRLKVTDYIDATKDHVAWYGNVNKQVLIGDVFGVAGIAFGSAIDAIVYRGTVAGQVSVSNGLAVINGGSTANQLLTLVGVAGQTGKAIQYVNSVGAEIWSVSAGGVVSPSAGTPDPISITGNVTAHNADARLTLIGDIFGSAGIGMGSTADTILVRSSAGAARISDTLTVQNVSHSSANVVAAIGASGQSGYLFIGIQNTGGTVFGVSNAGVITALGLSNGNGGITGAGAISGVTSLSASGAISGVTTIGASGTVTCGAVTATGVGRFDGGIDASAGTNVTSFFDYLALNYIGITGGASGLGIDATGLVMKASAFTVSPSSGQFKTNVEPFDPAEHNGLLGMRPVRFDLVDSPLGRQVGFIAEELAEAFPDAVVLDDDGSVMGINYNAVVTLLVQGYQRLAARVEVLEAA